MNNNYGENPDPEQEKEEIYLANKIYFDKKYSKLEEKLKKENYEDFVNNVIRWGVLENIGEDTYNKRELLTKYFSKFRNEGKQPINNYSFKQIGDLFQGILKYAKKITKK